MVVNNLKIPQITQLLKTITKNTIKYIVSQCDRE